MTVIDHPLGQYQFLPLSADPRIQGNAPFSGGVIAQPGYEIVHAIFQAPLPYHAGFAAAARHLETVGRPKTTLCAVELRCPEPYTIAGFRDFNGQYRGILMEWGVFVDGQNPIARSNIAPGVSPPTETLLYAISYTAPTTAPGPTFVVSGAPEKASVRPGETTPDALREKTASAMAAMDAGLGSLGVGWGDVTVLNLYTQHNLHDIIEAEILVPMGPAAAHGIRWYWSRPPMLGLEVEVDVRGVQQEILL